VESTRLDEQAHHDERLLASFGYRQRLRRVMGIWENFSVGFTYLSPVVGVYAVFAYGLATGGPAFIWTIPIVMLGQLMVALTFAEIASQYPIAGGIYQWAKLLVGNRYAWFSGWYYTAALLITIAAVAFGAAPFLGPLFGYAVTPGTTVITAIAVIVIAGLINLSGVRRLAFVSKIGMAAELGGSILIGLGLLLAGREHGPSIILHTQGAGAEGGYLNAFLGASLFAVWIFYGFEACGDVAEEVVDPGRTVPRAMIMTLLIGGAAALFITFALILAVPDIAGVLSGKVVDPVGAALENAFGSFGAKVSLVVVAVAFLSCTLSIQAAASRLIFSYARDRMIFGSRWLSHVSERSHMPVGAVVVAALIPAVLTLLPTATVARIIAFAVIGIYVSFQLVVLASLIARSRGWRPAGTFRMGPAGVFVNLMGLAYGVTAIVVLIIHTPPAGEGFFDRWLVGLLALLVAVIGLVYMVIVRPEPEIHPEHRAEAGSGT
jgi:amino acid transporter